MNAPVRSGAARGLPPERARAAYLTAIDAHAASEDAHWWAEVIAEVDAVVAAPDTRSAAALITWWHADWRAIGDTPLDAARRLRAAARAPTPKHRATP